MKRYLLIILFALVSLAGMSQQPCNPPTDFTAEVNGTDVQLHWSAPETSVAKDYLDVQFTYETYFDDGESGVESDGNYIYTCKWLNDVFAYYDLDGNFIDSFYIPGAERVRDMAYCETDGYFYGAQPLGDSGRIYKMDFASRTLIDVISLNESVRSLAYDPDLDIFYGNNWSGDVLLIDRQTGSIQDHVPLTGGYGDYYGFAYDKWSDGGPYVWGFSQAGSGAEIVQLLLPGFTETGLVYDASGLDTNANGIAGGLFTQAGIVEGKISLGGMIQNRLIFGLELGSVSPPAHELAGYNVYRSGNLLNTEPLADTLFTDQELSPGTYQYQLTAVYEDMAGTFVCESDPAGPLTAIVEEPLVLGGNIFAGIYKLDMGEAIAYSDMGDSLFSSYTVEVNEFGYYYFVECIPGIYYIHSRPSGNSSFYAEYIPTYYGGAYHWEDATPVTLEENIFNADIQLVPIAAMGSGAGRISGKVSFEEKDFGSSPASDVQMLLLRGGECVAIDYSDPQGYFSFAQLENGTYMLLCEIPGKKMQPLVYVIDDENLYEDGIHFIISGDEVVAGIDDGLPSGVSFFSELYPNPAGEHVHVEIAVHQSQSLSILVNTLAGTRTGMMTEHLLPGTNSLKIDVSSLPSGVYMLNFVFENKGRIIRKMLVL